MLVVVCEGIVYGQRSVCEGDVCSKFSRFGGYVHKYWLCVSVIGLKMNGQSLTNVQRRAFLIQTWYSMHVLMMQHAFILSFKYIRMSNCII